MDYIPNTPEEREEMLKVIGADGVEAFFQDIPSALRLDRPLNLPEGLSECDLKRHMESLGAMNKPFLSFLGAGAYEHYSPAAVNHMTLRGEFFTAYTPYQPEVAQGTLQVIFEFQTLVCNLTGMEAANASLYDGSTALAEAALMACRVSRRGEIAVSSAVHPQHLETLRSYLKAQEIAMKIIDSGPGGTCPDSAREAVSEKTAALIVQSPNVFGTIEKLAPFSEIAHSKKALSVAHVLEATSLGILKPPGEQGADIVVGEGQGFGVPVGFGGPYVGFMAARKEHLRQMPGRLCGITKDGQGRRGFVLTLQAREQHIRRAKANSNICTNEGLYALWATVHLAALGKSGLREVAVQNARKARYAARRMGEIEGISLWNEGDFYNEFSLAGPDLPRLVRRMTGEGVVPGFPHDGKLIVCVTETKTKGDIDRLTAIARAALEEKVNA